MPWENFDLTMTKRLLSLASACALGCLASLPAETDLIPNGFDVANMDRSVRPGDDFFRFANGGWLDATAMPADKSRWGAFDTLAENNWRRIHNLLEEISSAPQAPDSEQAKIADFFRTAMDTPAIDAAGLTPLHPELDRIATIHDLNDLARYVADAHRGIGSPLFGAYPYADQRNNNDVIMQFVQGGLSLPDRDYYFDAKHAEYLPQFVEHVAKMFVLAGESPDTAQTHAELILTLETKLAGFSKTVAERRDPEANYHKLPRAEAPAEMPKFPLELYLATLGVPDSETELDLRQIDFFRSLSSFLAETPLDDLKTYLRWHAIHDAAPYLASDFETENFHFFSTVLSGTPEQEPRWKRAAQRLDSALGFAVGKIYVSRYFPPAVRDRLEEMVASMRAVLTERIENLDWMSPETKIKALEKLHTFRVVIGYPPEWRDYTGLKIDHSSHYANVLRSAHFETARQMAQLPKPFDKGEWRRSPQQVNAYYQPSAGQLVFLAGILQPPFFDPELDDAVNYGAICGVIGHEITHGFDDKGRLYDAHGNLNDWWSAVDTEKFKARAQKLVDQYNAYEVLPGVFVKGDQTLGENIADLGGASIALEALQRSLVNKGMMLIDGFTPVQRFFIAWAQQWRTQYRDDALKRTVASGVHSPGTVRSIGPLVNMPEFYEAFDLKAGDPMWRAPEDRAKIW